MIRRIVWYNDRGAVKWALIAAAFGLSLGYFAEHTLAARTAKKDATVAEQVVEVRSSDAARGAS